MAYSPPVGSDRNARQRAPERFLRIAAYNQILRQLVAQDAEANKERVSGYYQH
jgi:hypothetical protein